LIAARLKKQFPRIEKMTGRRGKPAISRIAAKYPLSRQYSCPALKRMYLVYEAIENMKAKHLADKQRKSLLLKVLTELDSIRAKRSKVLLGEHDRQLLEDNESRLYDKARELLSQIKMKNLQFHSRTMLYTELKKLKKSRRFVDKTPLWKLGMELNVLGKTDLQKKVLDDREKSIYTKTMSNLHARAKSLIENTAKGVFPVG
jgi:hypothetical protein